MPVLEIADTADDLHALVVSGPRVLATMLHPADKSQREHCTRLFGAFMNLQDEPSREAVFLSFREKTELPLDRWRSGIISGHILYLIRQIDTHHPEVEASVGKAAHVISVTREIFGKSVKRSTILSAWSNFKSVAHFWVAGWCLSNVSRPTTDGIIMGNLVLSVLDHFKCRELVSVAEEWRRFGENQVNRQGSSVLNPNETWVAPSGYELTSPSPLFPAGGYVPEIPLLSQIELQALKEYKAPAPY